MAINFTTNIEKYTAASTRTHNVQFTTYASKKQLAQANVLDAQALEFVLAIKNTFSFALHNEKRFMAITLYYASTKTYGFIVVDLHNKAIAEVASIKQAKAEIMALVNEQ